MSINISYIDTDNVGSPDYTSLNGWDAGEARNLTTGSEIEIAECRCTSGSADTSQVTLGSDWTTSSGSYIHIRSDPSYRHTGSFNTSAYRLQVTDNTIIVQLGVDHSFWEGIQFEHLYDSGGETTGGTFNCAAETYDSGGTAYLKVKNCIFKGTTSYTTSYHTVFRGFSFTNTLTSYWINCIAYDYGTVSSLRRFIHANDSDNIGYVYNCLVQNINTALFTILGTSWTIYNTIAQDCSQDVNGRSYTSGDYNLSDDAEGSNSWPDDSNNGVFGSTLTFADKDGDDFHLNSTDTDAMSAALNLYDDQYFPFQNDIDYGDRGGSGALWDIGPDQYGEGGASSSSSSVSSSSVSSSSESSSSSSVSSSCGNIIIEDIRIYSSSSSSSSSSESSSSSSSSESSSSSSVSSSSSSSAPFDHSFIYFDGFEGIAIGDLSKRFTSVTAPNNSIITGRDGIGKAVRKTYNSQSWQFSYTWSGVADQEIVAGIAFRITAGNSNVATLLQLIASDGNWSVAARYNRSANRVDFYRKWGVGESLVASSNTLSEPTWHYVELLGRSHNTLGRCVGYVNGTKVADYTGDTYYASTTLNQWRVYDSVWTGMDVDDLYILRVDGDSPSKFLGDSYITLHLPSGNGNYSEMGPSGSANNYDCVNDDPLSTTNFVIASADAIKDTYKYTKVTGLNEIFGVQVATMANRKDSASDLDLIPLCRTDGAVPTDHQETSQTIDSDSVQEYFGIYQDVPSGTTTWSLSAVNNSEFGFELNRDSGTNEGYLYQTSIKIISSVD